MLTVKSRKFYSQIENGESFSSDLSDFSLNLTGSVMERIRAEIEIELSVVSSPSPAIGTLTFYFDVDDTAKTITMTDQRTSWAAEGWRITDNFAVTGDLGFTGTITAINGQVLTYTLSAGTDTTGSYTNLLMVLSSDYTAAVWQYNVVENGDPVEQYANITDGSDQLFTLAGLTTSYGTMNPGAGAKSWITGNAQIKKTSLSLGVATYTIIQDFIILPYYLQDFDNDFAAGTSPVDFFAGNFSLKFIYSLELRRNLSDPNTSQVFSENTQLGSVGWFNENFDGFTNNYNLDSVSYNDTDSGDVVTGVQIDNKTTVTAVISSAGLFNTSTKVGAYFSAILAPFVYEVPTNVLFADKWLFDNYVRTIDNTYSGLSGVIKRFSSSLNSANQITVEIDIEFSASQQANLIDGQEFIIGWQTADSSKTSRAASDVVMLNSGLGTMTKNSDVSGLMNVLSMEHLIHPQAESDLGHTDVKGWVEDGIFTKMKFDLDIEIPSRLQQLTFKLLARNSSANEFVIQEYPFDLSSGILQPFALGSPLFKQAFNLNTTRGFPLVSGDYFNIVRLKEYVDLPAYRYGEFEQDVSPKTVPYIGNLSSTPYITVFDDQDGISPVYGTQAVGSLVSTALALGGNVSFFSLVSAPEITGIRGGTKTLVAGTNIVNFTTLGGTNYTIYVWDQAGGLLNLSGMNASKTATQFEIVCTVPTTITWIAVLNTLTDFRCGTETIPAGAYGVNFSSTLGSDDFTLLILDTQNGSGNLSNRAKRVIGTGFDGVAIVATEINYIAILNP